MIYLASPYSNPNQAIVEKRFRRVEFKTAALMSYDIPIYSPIVHCHALATKYKLPTDAAFWQAYNNDFIRASTALWVLTLPGWRQSLGVLAEIDFAKSIDKPIFTIEYTSNEPVLWSE